MEPGVHAPEGIQPARIGGIGVVDDAVLELERTHPRPLARVRGHVGSGHDRVIADRVPSQASRHPLVVLYLPGGLTLVVVFDAFALLLLGKRGAEVEVEFAADRGRPGKGPPHPPFVVLQLGERRPGHSRERDVVVRRYGKPSNPSAIVEQGCAPRRVVGPEYEVVDEEPRAPSEESSASVSGRSSAESIRLVDPNPRRLTLPRQLSLRRVIPSALSKRARREPLLRVPRRLVMPSPSLATR